MLYVFAPSNIHDSVMLQLVILAPTKGDVPLLEQMPM